MDKQEQELKNQVVAKFMGWKEFNAFSATNPGDGDDCWQYEDMRFHESWDWLMDAVEKINTIVVDNQATRVTMRSNATLIERVGEEGWEAGMIVTSKGMKLNTFEAIVQFIKHENKRKSIPGESSSS
jgi:hypothetical protein